MTASQLPVEQPAGPGQAPEPTLESPEDERRRRRKAILLLALLAFLVSIIALLLWYLIFRQPIRPSIPVIPDMSLPHYSTSVYGVQRPMGVAVTSSGDRIFVTQTDDPPGVLMFDGSGSALGTFETPPDVSDQVPVYLAIDPLTQEVYVSDRLAGAIYVYDLDGHLLRQYQPATSIPGWQPLGLAFDKAGDLYVTDLATAPQQVEVFDRNGALIRTIGTTEAMSFPNGIAIDGAGYVYVTDSNNGRLLVFDQSGTMIGQVGRGTGQGNLGLPRGVAVTGDRVYVADVTGQGVYTYRPVNDQEPRPQYVGFYGGLGVGDGQFQFPNGIAVDGRGRVYVTDSVNDRVQVWSY